MAAGRPRRQGTRDKDCYKMHNGNGVNDEDESVESDGESQLDLSDHERKYKPNKDKTMLDDDVQKLNEQYKLPIPPLCDGSDDESERQLQELEERVRRVKERKQQMEIDEMRTEREQRRRELMKELKKEEDELELLKKKKLKKEKTGQIGVKSVLLLGDSIIKYVEKIDWTLTRSISGVTIGALSESLKRDQVTRLRTGNQMVPADVTCIMFKILQMLKFLHSHNIVHYDLKEHNVVLRNGNDPSTVRLIDFGAVKTNHGTWNKGGDTPIMCPPNWQEIEKQTTVNDLVKSKDIYAVAKIGYYLLTSMNVNDATYGHNRHYGDVDLRKKVKENIAAHPERLYEALTEYHRNLTPAPAILAKLINLLMRLSRLDETISASEYLDHPVFSELRELIQEGNPYYKELKLHDLPQFRTELPSIEIHHQEKMMFYQPVREGDNIMDLLHRIPGIAIVITSIRKQNPGCKLRYEHWNKEPLSAEDTVRGNTKLVIKLTVVEN